MRILRAFTATTVALAASCVWGQQASSGTFVLHKFAQAIGEETYSIDTADGKRTLHSHFLFTDRGSPVPLETTFVAQADGTPLEYTSKGRASRLAALDDHVAVSGATITEVRSGKSSTATPSGAWFVTDGYSPVAMQEQMMRWWLAHGRPAAFTIYPSGATVRITPAAVLHAGIEAQGYMVAGLIWGNESLWMDKDANLVALVGTDAEFDHFEAIRKPYAAKLGDYIAAAAKDNLNALRSLSATARAPVSHVLAITGATIENPDGSAPIPDGVIVVTDGVISAVGSKAQVKVPKGATVIDAAGKWAIPGLWDMHAHYEQVEWGPVYLASGITSVRDVGNEFDLVRTLHEELDRKKDPAIGPHLEFAGIIDGPGPMALGAVTAGTPEEGRAQVDRYVAAGARQIKIYSSVKPEVLKAITAEAHAKGLTVTGHIPNGMTALEGIDDGMDQINHVQYLIPYVARPKLDAEGKPDLTQPPVLDPDGPRAKEMVAALKAHGTIVDPTVAIFEQMLHTGPYDALEPGVDHLPPQLREAMDSPPAPPTRAAAFNAFTATLRVLHQGGIPIVAGTDQTIPGYSLHRELELYVQNGFTPQEALATATINAAKALGLSDSGTIAVGKRGDVTLLGADPLADIHNTRRVWKTVAAGAVYDPAALWTSVGFKP